jgi:hypothetical protein
MAERCVTTPPRGLYVWFPNELGDSDAYASANIAFK